MSGRAHILIHPAIERGLDALPVTRKLGMGFTELSARPSVDELKALEKTVQEAGERPVLLCTLKIANDVLRHCPGLARGVSLNRDFVKPSCFGACLPEEILLNAESFFLPWGRIPDRARQLEQLFPGGIFLRPDSGMKSFTGFAVTHDALLSEWRSIGQLHAMQPEEMVQISPRKDISEVEYRVWVLDGQPVTAAAYGWRVLAASERTVPKDILHAAHIVAGHLAMRAQDYTADFVLENGVPRLVEINGFSTSGWYAGLDIEALLTRVDEIFF